MESKSDVSLLSQCYATSEISPNTRELLKVLLLKQHKPIISSFYLKFFARSFTKNNWGRRFPQRSKFTDPGKCKFPISSPRKLLLGGVTFIPPIIFTRCLMPCSNLLCLTAPVLEFPCHLTYERYEKLQRREAEDITHEATF